MATTYVYDFAHGDKDQAALLGGKGANLAEMTSVLELPVPPGFTITTDACRAYMVGGWPDGLDEEVAKHRKRLEKEMLEAARNLEFERAAQLRDRLKALKERLFIEAA